MNSDPKHEDQTESENSHLERWREISGLDKSGKVNKSANINLPDPPMLVKDEPKEKNKPKPVSERKIKHFEFVESPEQYIPNLTLRFKNGDWFLLRYGNLDNIFYNSDHGVLFLETMTKVIKISGQRLSVLRDFFNQENECVLTEISESKTKRDDENSMIFVESITIEEKTD